LIAVVKRAVGLLAIYLLVLTSLKPGDIVIGAILALTVSWALTPRYRPERRVSPTGAAAATLATIGATLAEMARGTIRTVRFCLSPTDRSGPVEIPREGRSRHATAFWGVLVGESPDEVALDVDEERDVLVVHLIDASDPDGVRARHHRDRERQSKVVP
jgi:multisubunit Na+/H+ antiporter MnhE subunit